MLKEDKLGFDLDIETVRLFDAIITNISKDENIKEEFKKLSFIRSLQDKYDDTDGPIEQLLEKVAQIERHRFEERIDIRNLIAEVETLSVLVEKYLPRPQREILKQANKISASSKYYSYYDVDGEKE